MPGQRLVGKGFEERELARRTERFRHVARVFSTSEGCLQGDEHALRGINGIQRMHVGRRWWVVPVMREAGNPKLALPAGYLPGKPAP